MNVQSIDLRDELRQGVQSCLALAPVVFRAPIARERLSRGELHALCGICDRFSLRPFCRIDAPAQFSEFRLRNIYLGKRANRILVTRLLTASLCSNGLGHSV